MTKIICVNSTVDLANSFRQTAEQTKSVECAHSKQARSLSRIARKHRKTSYKISWESGGPNKQDIYYSKHHWREMSNHTIIPCVLRARLTLSLYKREMHAQRVFINL